MNNDSNLYHVLGVAQDSDDVVIQAAYKALMRKYHPDTNRDPNATARAQAINAAFDILGNVQRRAAYDAARSTQRAHTPPPPPEDPAPPPQYTPPPNWKPSQRGFTWSKKWTVGATAFVLVGFIGNVLSGLPINQPTNVAPAVIDAAAAAVAADSASVVSPPPTSEPQQASLQWTAPQNNTSLPSPAMPISFDDLDHAARDFDRVLSKRGMLGAKAYSESCHKELTTNPTWAAADQCTAFDIAAAHIDGAIASASNGTFTQNDYFRFKNDNPNDTYTQLGIDRSAAQERIDGIRREIGSIVDNVISGRLNRERAAREAVTPAAVSAPNANGTAAQLRLQAYP
jgi:hypothetical protein